MSAPLPPLGGVGLLRWAWRQLTSMKTALILLFLLAIASIPGSVLPQQGNDPLKVKEWIAGSPTWGQILKTAGFFNVFASPWFAAVYLLLFISLIGCVLPRARQHWKAMLAPPPPAPRNLARLAGTRSLELTGDRQSPEGVDGVLADATTYLRKRRWRVVQGPVDTEDGSRWISAEKGYLRETGNLLFHVSLIFILVAIGVGGLFGWKGNVIVKEGGGFANTVTQYDAWGGGRFSSADSLTPFSFNLNTFDVEFEREGTQRGAPRFFKASVTYRGTPTAAPEAAVIEVNEPLEVDRAKVFLVGHGYAPHFIVKDSTGNVVFDDSVVFLPQDGNFTSTGVVKVPDSTPQLGLRGLFLPTASLDSIRGGQSIFPAPDDPAVFLSAFTGDLGLDAGTPQSVYTLDSDKMTQIGLATLRPGQTWTWQDGSGSVEFAGFDRWASFQIAYDPGKEAALISAILAITGLTMSLFIRRRRIWVKVLAPVTLVQIAGLTKSSSLDDIEAGALTDDITALHDALSQGSLDPARTATKEQQ
jgi:cytochrome c biogenesis protein